MDLIANLEAMLARGDDSATLRFALASRYLTDGRPEAALEHAAVAVQLDADYSAAWKLLGKAQAAAGRAHDAAMTYRHGIGVAERCGDQQAAKEMRVFLKRLQQSSEQ
jgi:Tfp pilus assembly protein PilF